MSNDVITSKTSVVPSLKNMSIQEIATLTGQNDTSLENNQGLPRFAINHSEEDNEGRNIPRGQFSLKIPELNTMVYAKEAELRIFCRFYTYSRWDVAENTFGCQTIQAPNLSADFYDTEGNLRCGRLTKGEVDNLPKDSPELTLHKSVKCNQVLYNTVKLIDPVDADGKKVEMKNETPSVWYIRGSSFIPVSDHIKMIGRKQVMSDTVNKVATSRKKLGGNSYYVPTLSVLKNIQTKDGDQELMNKFFETRDAINKKVINAWKTEKEKRTKTEKLSDFGEVLASASG
jgi:hypothetical protein